MIYRKPRVDEERGFDLHAKHPLQSFAWGEFRRQTGVEVRRLIGFDDSEMVASLQVTFHSVPKLPYTVGYLPKGLWPDEVQLQALTDLGKEEGAIFIKIEPDVAAPPHNQADLDGLEAFLLENKCQKGKGPL